MMNAGELFASNLTNNPRKLGNRVTKRRRKSNNFGAGVATTTLLEISDVDRGEKRRTTLNYVSLLHRNRRW